MKRTIWRRSWIALVLVAIVSPAILMGGEEPKTNPAELTLDRIFNGGEFQASSVDVRWRQRGAGYTVLENVSGPGRNIVRYAPASEKGTIVVPASHLIPPGSTTPLSIDAYSFSKDDALVLIYTNSKRVWRRNTRGDYWLLDRSSRELRQLGGDASPSSLMFAKISPTGRHVAYVRDRNIYVEDLLDHSIRQVTETKTADIINGTFDWVYEEELSLRDGFRWSPDGLSIAYWQLDTSGVRKFPLVNNTIGLYPRIKIFPYPKVGQRNSVCRVGVTKIHGGKTRWMEVPGDPRNHYIARMEWVDSKEIVLQQLNRRQNTNRVMLANAIDASVVTVLTERDEAWVDLHDEMIWRNGRQEFTWISERDGWRHIYLVSRSGGAIKLITAGEYDVIQLLHVDDSQDCIYFTASPDNPCQMYLYRIQFDGTGLMRMTPADESGTHQYDISPNGRFAIVTSSSCDQPPVTRIVNLPDHSAVRSLDKNENLRKSLAKLRRQPTEFLRVDIGDGAVLDGWCIRPPDMDPSKKYPLLIHVYGEPAGQSVRDRWGGANYLWHLMLAQRGYVVMCFDNRGTPAPRSRNWRKCVYRKVGILAPQEQAAAVKVVLEQRPYLDSERVGVWGWSGGGSMSLNALFKYPELYKMAISIAPVPNQRFYDTIYQERYMGLPGDNVEGFFQGSPINFAHQLKGDLLLIHGTGDDNCHYQTTEMLINELIRHNKPFSMMAYPNRSHSIREGKNTTRHLRELMTSYLSEHLPAGPL